MARRSKVTPKPNTKTRAAKPTSPALGGLRQHISSGRGVNSASDGAKIQPSTTIQEVVRCEQCGRGQAVTAALDGRKGQGPRRVIGAELARIGWARKHTGDYCPTCLAAEPAAAKANRSNGPRSKVDVARAQTMLAEGATYEEIGEAFGVTRQRIHQLLNA